jgi:hypothetical protein
MLQKIMSRMEMKLKMENDIDVGQDQSYLECVFVFHEIYDIGVEYYIRHAL